MAKKKTTGKLTHDITVRVPGVKVGNADICFDVKKGGTKIGTFQISKGNIELIPANAQRKANDKYRGRRISWEKLAEYLLEETNEKQITKKA